MGNRNRRGSRPRSVPHKHGGVSGPAHSGRAPTHLIPPILPASAPSAAVDGFSAAPSADIEDEGESVESEAETSVSAPVSISAEEEVTIVEQWPLPAADESSDMSDDVSGAREATAPGRGRFYVPGQTRPRFERAERVAPTPPQSDSTTAPVTPVTPAAPAVSPPPPTLRRARQAEEGYEADGAANGNGRAQNDGYNGYNGLNGSNGDEDAEYTGPRGDVRGSVGVLIDSLREMFTRDRAIASQGSVARCGVCYLHFPTNELIYRENDGFYVCESCAHALGVARVPMVRRQQKQ